MSITPRNPSCGYFRVPRILRLREGELAELIEGSFIDLAKPLMHIIIYFIPGHPGVYGCLFQWRVTTYY